MRGMGGLNNFAYSPSKKTRCDIDFRSIKSVIGSSTVSDLKFNANFLSEFLNTNNS